MRSGCRSARGFSLVEVLVATTILIVAVASGAQLLAAATRGAAIARSVSIASALATQKMENLRTLSWTFDAAGSPLSDTTSYGTGLTPSPSDTLDRDVAGYSEFLDANGEPATAAGASFVRRWSIAPLPADPANALVLQVVVLRVQPASGALVARAHLATVRFRKGR